MRSRIQPPAYEMQKIGFEISAPPLEIADRHSSLGGEFGERIDPVKDASFARAGEAGATHP
jgi:hypothetical protein